MKNRDLLISHWSVLFQINKKKYLFIKCIIISKSWVNVLMFQNNFYEKYLSEKITRLWDYNCVGVTFSGQFIMSLRKVFSFNFFFFDNNITETRIFIFLFYLTPVNFCVLRFRQTQVWNKWRFFIKTIKSLCFYWIHCTSTIYVTIFVAGFLKLK